MKIIKVFTIVLIILALSAVIVARLTAPNSYFTIYDVAPSTFRTDLNLMRSIIEISKTESGKYPADITLLIPKHGLALSKGFCNNNLRYTYPGIHNPDSYDIWFEPCKELQTKVISNW